jgi:hypothetical protein
VRIIGKICVADHYTVLSEFFCVCILVLWIYVLLLIHWVVGLGMYAMAYWLVIDGPGEVTWPLLN